jgi:type I restriction enzyme S subunit
MLSEWREVKLGQVVTLNPDTIGDDWPYSFIKYIDISSVSEGLMLEPPRVIPLDHVPTRAKRLVRAGDTVVSTVRPGRRSMFFVKQSEPEWVLSTGFAVLRPRREFIEPRYLYACVQDKAFTGFLVSREKGAAYPAVLPQDIAAAVIKLPLLPEQRAIAHILGTLDDKIELNRRMSETLEAMARALFKAWFVDFEPVRAKMEGRWRRGQSLPGLPAHLYDLFPDRLVDSELGPIPEGWEMGRLADYVDTVKGVSYKGSALGSSGMPLHNLNSIYEGGGYKYEGIKFYIGEYAEHHVVRPGDVIVANTEQGHDRLLIGYAAIVPRLFGDRGIASHHIYRVRPKPDGLLTSTYLCYLLNSPGMHDIVSGYANGTTVNMLPIDGLQKPKLVCPPRPLVMVFDSFASNAEERREEIVAESRTLAALRDALLPKLISGEIRVKDAERFLKERGL